MSDNVNPFGQPNQQPNSTPATPPSPFGQAATTPGASNVSTSQTTPTSPAPTAGQPTTPTSPFAGANMSTGATNPVGSMPGTGMPTTPNGATQPFGTSGGSIGNGSAPMAGGTAPMTVKAKHGNKKMLFGIIGSVVAVLIIIAVVIVFLVSGRVTADDYDQAVDTLVGVNDSASDLTSDFDLYSVEDMDDSELNDMIDALNQAMDDGQGQLDKLGKMKAITSDDDAKSLYDALNSKYGEYSDRIKGIITDVQQVMPVVRTINDLEDSSVYGDYSQLASVYQQIADTAKNTKVDNEELASALSDLADACQDFADYANQLAAGNYSADTPDMDKIYDATSRIQDVFSYDDLFDLSSDLSDCYYDLYDYLSDQRNELAE